MTDAQKQWRSCAKWNSGVVAAANTDNVTTDFHDTREAAVGVCQLLLRRGFGGDGVHFPVRTWVEWIEEVTI